MFRNVKVFQSRNKIQVWKDSDTKKRLNEPQGEGVVPSAMENYNNCFRLIMPHSTNPLNFGLIQAFQTFFERKTKFCDYHQ